MSDNLTMEQKKELNRGVIRLILASEDILEKLNDAQQEALTAEEVKDGIREIDSKLSALEETLGI